MTRKSKFVALAAAAVLAFGTLLAQAAPQTTTPPAYHKRGAWGKRGFRAGRLGKLSTYLNLTDTQKTQAKSIFDAARASAQPIVQELKQNRQAMQQAVKSGQTAQIQPLADAQGVLMGKLIGIRSNAFSQFYALLTPDQQAKLSQLHNRHKPTTSSSGSTDSSGN